MRRLLPLAALALMLVVVGCGEANESVPAADPEQPVQAPADQVATPAPAAPKHCKRVSRRLVGRSVGAARSIARKARCSLRVVIEDGRNLPVTEDFSRSRINVRVDDGEIVEVVGRF
jgi:hypothetical protein